MNVKKYRRGNKDNLRNWQQDEDKKKQIHNILCVGQTNKQTNKRKQTQIT